MATIFHTYHNKDGITTLRGMVSRWAPPNENNTGAYLNDVCNRLQWGPDQPFDFSDAEHMAALLKAFSTHEVGSWAFNDNDCRAGVATSH